MKLTPKGGICILRGAVDLRAWLEQHGLTIRVWRTNLGYAAEFVEPYRVEGKPPTPGGATELAAVQNFVWSFRGARLCAINWPTPIIVPEFCGIEEAVTNATIVEAFEEKEK
jgi:hypothetical protein